MNKFIKIGKTNGLSARLSSLQSSNPNTLVCLNIIENESDDHVYHKRFEACCHRAEWFRPDAELISFIDSLPYVDIQKHLDIPFGWLLLRK